MWCCMWMLCVGVCVCVSVWVWVCVALGCAIQHIGAVCGCCVWVSVSVCGLVVWLCLCGLSFSTYVFYEAHDAIALPLCVSMYVRFPLNLLIVENVFAMGGFLIWGGVLIMLLSLHVPPPCGIKNGSFDMKL